VAYALRFEGLHLSPEDWRTALIYFALALPIKLAVLYTLGLYSRLWRHASLPELRSIAEAGTVCATLCAVTGIILLPSLGVSTVRVPISVAFLDGFLSLAIVALPRLTVRVLGARHAVVGLQKRKRALIVGAGAAGNSILKELRANPELGLKPIGFVDDDSHKHRMRLGNLPVFGSLTQIPEIVDRENIQEIIVAMPRAPGHVIRNVVRLAAQANVPTRTVPGLFELVSGRVRVSNLRRVEIQDLLRREPIETDLDAVRAITTRRTVLITGAGGSIGSELARQIASLEPAHLVLLGNVENEIFDILNELVARHPSLAVSPVICDVRDRERLQFVFRQFPPDAVYHAAAHKHVPLMEANAHEAITNNVHGTRNLVECTLQSAATHFVFISTDKAVRPTNVMGASKRAAEMIVQRAAAEHSRNFVSVRFGNVLGSRGSMIPIFLGQIESGGPVTITHPEMRRFFMTIPEAVQLVLQAAAIGTGGEVFALDMGIPVRIVDLAADLIRLSGLEVGKDIKIRYTGIRPGERLSEEVFFQGEDIQPTPHPKILRARNISPPPEVLLQLERLISAARRCRPNDEVRRLLADTVPEFIADVGAAGAAPAASPVSLAAQDSRRFAALTMPDRRTGSDRRRRQRRSGLDSRHQLHRLTRSERRSSRDRRSDIDRRTAPQPKPSPRRRTTPDAMPLGFGS
jgi:FlaA1/EpsC-like NDP-sugar epimerase